MQLYKNRKSIQKTVLVLGGYGYIGRYTVASLNRAGLKTIVGTRHEGNNSLQIKLHESLDLCKWLQALEGIDAVVNTVGILRERKGETFEQVHHLAVRALSQACQKRNIPLIHMSALGINGGLKNSFATSKLRGEAIILDSGCRGAIVRASIVNALDGYGSSWMYKVAKWPIWFLPSGATKRLCPIEAEDLGQALTNLVLTHTQSKQAMEIIEVGGQEVFTLESYLCRLRNQQDSRPANPLITLRIPKRFAKCAAKLFDICHLTPYSIGHHELLEHDNLPTDNRLSEILGRAPLQVGTPRFCLTKPNLVLAREKA